MHKAVLITGSSRGIGRATAIELARAGYAIALNTDQESSELQQTADAIKQLGVPLTCAAFDVSQIDTHVNWLDKIERDIGPLSALVNNAGVGVMSRGDLLDVTEASYDRCMAINCKALFFLSQKFAQRLIARQPTEEDNCCIVNVTSANAVAVAEQRAEYCASKSAASILSSAFAVRLGRENIRVFDIQPGLIDTALTAPVIESYRTRAAQGLCVLPRVGKVEDVAKVITTVVEGRLPYITGQTLSVDGGMLIPRF